MKDTEAPANGSYLFFNFRILPLSWTGLRTILNFGGQTYFFLNGFSATDSVDDPLSEPDWLSRLLRP